MDADCALCARGARWIAAHDVRGEFGIVPMQTPGENLMLGRENAFSLLVASSSEGTASGTLYWDDGESIGE
ncbi:MAG: DUF393 domain-containing protein [Sphingopyxis sp.]|nr:DUF393 domain-containing protein [Sphingopyxis sp.]